MADTPTSESSGDKKLPPGTLARALNLIDDPFTKWLNESVGISDELLESLLTGSDDDWTFVIKMHGILEAGLNHLLLTKLGDHQLIEVVSRLETNNERSGKMAFIKAYGLLKPDACLFVQLLSKIRNRCVHDIKNFNFSLRQFFNTQDSKQLKNWKTALTSWVATQPVPESFRERAIEYPRSFIFNCCLNIVVISYFNQKDAAEEQQKIQQATEFFENRTMWPGFDSHHESTPKAQ